MVKKIFLFSLMFAFVASTAFAASPVQKGNITVGATLFNYTMGSGDLHTTNGKKDSSYTFGVFNNPEFGYFVIDGLSIGGKFLYSREKSGDDTIKTYYVGPAVIYYIAVSEKLLPFVGLSYDYIKMKFSNGSSSAVGKGYQIAPQLGVTFMMGNNLGLFASYTYKDQKIKFGDNTIKGKENVFDIGVKAFF